MWPSNFQGTKIFTILNFFYALRILFYAQHQGLENFVSIKFKGSVILPFVSFAGFNLTKFHYTSK